MARKKTPINKGTKTPATAAGQALGYGLQYTRLTMMLLEARPGSICSLEVFDDVAEQTATGESLLVQSKSALTNNPVADRSIFLWKTFYNWIELVKTRCVVPAQTNFQLYVSRQVSGDVVAEFSRATSSAEALSALAKARGILSGNAPDVEDRIELPESLARYVNPFFETDENILVPLIVNFQLVCGSGSPQADIEAEIRRGPVSGARVFDVADKLCGWVKRQIDKQLEKKLPAYISHDDFHGEYVAYVRMVDRELILKSMARKPLDEETKQHLPDMFVQQLDLVEISFDDKLAAISDFLQACSNRVLWSKAGDVHDESFAELDDNLSRTWANHRRATDVEAASVEEVERGRLLHARCMLHAGKVQGMEPPSHFISGCFHRLSDSQVIGWHPRYRDLLKSLASDAA